MPGMARYYFDIKSGEPYRDEVGEDLPDERAAWHIALKRTREIEDLLAPGGTWRLEVRGRQETLLFKIDITTSWLPAGDAPNDKS